VYFLRPDGEIDELKPGPHGLGDRAVDAPGRILIGCRLRLERQAMAAVNREIAHALRARPLLQTLSLPGAVVWKDPPGHSARALIAEAGLPSKRLNGAEVCAKHPAVVVNRGTATAIDVISLMQQVRERVLARTGVRLESSLRTVGELL
jgi:UDP-N-acetylmuramate dehydrogenase